MLKENLRGEEGGGLCELLKQLKGTSITESELKLDMAEILVKLGAGK